jgi:heme exporter protein C
VGVLAFIGLAIAHYFGLFVAPSEAMMGDVGRILYIHPQTAQAAMLCFLGAFVCAVGSLWSGKTGWDDAMASFAEVGVLLGVLLLAQGCLWAKPTWGVYWVWSPRLITSAIMVLSFVGVLVLRRLVDDPVRRATWSAVAAIVSAADVPIVWFSVKWWRDQHQMQSDAASDFANTFRWVAHASWICVMVLAGWMIWLRYRLARAERLRFETAAGLPPRAAPLVLEKGASS